MIQLTNLLTLTLKMTTAQVVETLVTVNNNSPIQDYVHPDDHSQSTFTEILRKLATVSFLFPVSFTTNRCLVHLFLTQPSHPRKITGFTSYGY